MTRSNLVSYAFCMGRNHFITKTYSKWLFSYVQKVYVYIKILTQGVVFRCPRTIYMYIDYYQNGNMGFLLTSRFCSQLVARPCPWPINMYKVSMYTGCQMSVYRATKLKVIMGFPLTGLVFKTALVTLTCFRVQNICKAHVRYA